jgi:hypothetical protein
MPWAWKIANRVWAEAASSAAPEAAAAGRLRRAPSAPAGVSALLSFISRPRRVLAVGLGDDRADAALQQLRGGQLGQGGDRGEPVVLWEGRSLPLGDGARGA